MLVASVARRYRFFGFCSVFATRFEREGVAVELGSCVCDSLYRALCSQWQSFARPLERSGERRRIRVALGRQEHPHPAQEKTKGIPETTHVVSSRSARRRNLRRADPGMRKGGGRFGTEHGLRKRESVKTWMIDRQSDNAITLSHRRYGGITMRRFICHLVTASFSAFVLSYRVRAADSVRFDFSVPPLERLEAARNDVASR